MSAARTQGATMQHKSMHEFAAARGYADFTGARSDGYPERSSPARKALPCDWNLPTQCPTFSTNVIPAGDMDAGTPPNC